MANRPTKPPLGAFLDRLHPRSRGLVAYYAMLEGAGSRLGDLVNGAGQADAQAVFGSWVGFPYGPAFDCNGSTTLATAPLVPNLTDLGPLTVNVLVRIRGGNGSIVQKYSGGSDGWEIQSSSSNISFIARVGSGTSPNRSITTPAVGAWLNLTFTWTGANPASSIRIFVNGVEPSSYSFSGNGANTRATDAAQHLLIGNDGGGNGINGSIASIKIWNRVLPDAEIAADAQKPFELLATRNTTEIGVPVIPRPFTRPLLVASAETADAPDAQVITFRSPPAPAAPKIPHSRPLWVISAESADAPPAEIITFRPAPPAPPPRIPFTRPLRVFSAETADAPDAQIITFRPPPFRVPAKFCTFPLHLWLAVDEAAYSRDLPHFTLFRAPPVNTLAVSAQSAGYYRVADPTLDQYELYVGVDTDPDFTSPPAQVSASLPMTTAALETLAVNNLVLRHRNAWNLVSQNNTPAVFDLSSTGSLNPTAPSDPFLIAIAPAAAGTALITASYNYVADGSSAADSFVVYLTTNGVDPNPDVDTPALVAVMIQSDGTARLSFTTPAYAEGTIVKTIVRTRRGSSPSVYSTGSTVYATTVTLLGPAATSASAFITSSGLQAQ